MNNRLLFLLLILSGLFLFALLVKDGKLLLLAMPFLVYLMVGFARTPAEIDLTADRLTSKSSVLAQESFEVQITIKNQGRALFNLFLADALFPSMSVLDGSAQSRLSLDPESTTELNYISTAGRGIYSWKTIHVCASDPFGLFELEQDIPAAGELLVRPSPIRIRNFPLHSKETLHATGPIPARLAGSGTDFWSVREYQSGDSLRHLNWRLATRYPRKLFTNEYERSEIGDFGLILDARRLTNDDALEETIFENSVSAAAAVAETFLKNGNRVALLTFGENIAYRFPGYGKRQLNSLLRDLSRIKLGSNVPLGYLEYFPARLFPSRSRIIIFSAVDTRDVATYAKLRAFGYEVLLISPDPIDYAARQLPSNKINTLAVRASRIERSVQLQRLLKLGIEVVDWQIHQPLELVLNKAASHSIQRRNIQMGGR